MIVKIIEIQGLAFDIMQLAIKIKGQVADGDLVLENCLKMAELTRKIDAVGLQVENLALARNVPCGESEV